MPSVWQEPGRGKEEYDPLELRGVDRVAATVEKINEERKSWMDKFSYIRIKIGVITFQAPSPFRQTSTQTHTNTRTNIGLHYKVERTITCGKEGQN